MFSLAKLLGLLGRVPAAVWLVLALGSWGLWGHHQANALRASIVAEKATQAQAVVVAERAATKSNQNVGDNFVNDTTTRAVRTRAAADRLRKRAAAKLATPTTGPACRSNAAPVEQLRDETREALIELADDADATADALRACQAYVREVVKPAIEPVQFRVEPAQPD